MQKIDSITLDTYEIVVAIFSMIDKANYIKFFEITFLLANVNPKIVFGKTFFAFSSIDVNF